MLSCWSCDNDIGELRKVRREELCASCQAWIHCCKNCHFWDASSRSCNEPAAEWVADRERANFCDFFALGAPDGPSSSSGRSDDDGSAGGRDAFDALFKR